MASKSVYTVNGKKFKTTSQADAERLYAKDFGGATPKGSSSPAPIPNTIKDPVTGNEYSIGASGKYERYTGAPAITPEQMQTTSKITLPSANTYDTSSALVSGVKSTLSSTKELSDAQKNVDLGYKRYDSYLKQLGQRGQRTQEMYDEYGIPKDTNKLKELNLQIAQKTGEYDKLIASLEGRGEGIPLSIVAGQQGAVQRQKAAEIGALASVAQALQGNIQLSQQLADSAIENEFYGIQQDIERTKLFIQQNQDKFTQAQKAQAEELNLYLDDYQLQVNQSKQDRKDILSYAAEVAAEGYPEIAQRISQLTDIEAAFAMASPYIGRMDRANQQSIMANRGSSGGGGGGGYSGDSSLTTSQVKNILNDGVVDTSGSVVFAGRGKDKYVDPNAYIYAYQNWGGTASEFAKAFPIDNVNPASRSYVLQYVPVEERKNTGSNPFAT